MCIDVDLFNALPAGLQHSLLLSAAESVKDTLQQCKLLLLIVDRYPGQVTEQGVCSQNLLFYVFMLKQKNDEDITMFCQIYQYNCNLYQNWPVNFVFGKS